MKRFLQVNGDKFTLALITGASSGIGLSLSHLLAAQGINLIISGRNTEKLEQLALELNKKVKVTIITADLNRESERQKIVEQIHHLKPDLIINNAGFGLYGNAVDLDVSKQLEMIEVNIKSLVQLTIEASHTLISANKKGTILNVSSAAAYFVYPTFAVYSASKTFINNFSEALNEELRAYQIKVLTACPGMVATEFRQRAGGSDASHLEQCQIMSPDFAANEIWNQIQKGKTSHVFDWKYRLYVSLSKIVPKFLLQKILSRFIKKRVVQRSI